MVSADESTASLPAKEEITFTVAAQWGGVFNALAIDRQIVYVGIGPRLATVDISDPTSPRLLWLSDVLPDVISAIAVQPGMVFLRVGAELLIYDARDPAKLVPVGTLSGISGQLYPFGDHVYTFAAGEPGGANRPLIAIDVTDPGRPTLTGTHQLSSTARVAVTEKVVYIASGNPFDDSSEAMLYLVDRSHLERVFSEVPLAGDWDHWVATSGDIAYVVENRLSDEPDLLLILDVSDPENPREIATWQMNIEKTISGIIASDHVLYLLARSFPHSGCPTTVNIIDVTDPAAPRGPVEIDPQSCFNEFALTGDTLVATSDRGLQIFKRGEPEGLELTGELLPQAGFMAVERIGLNQNLAYLLTTAGRNRLHKLRVLDLYSPTPRLLNGDGLDLQIEPSIFEGLDVRGDRLFGLGPEAVDISVPAEPRLVENDLDGVYYWPSPVLVGNTLYAPISPTTDGMLVTDLAVIDISDPANPILANTASLEGFSIMGLSTNERQVIVFSQKAHTETEESTVFITRLQLFDIRDPLMPVEVGRLEPAVDLPEQVWDLTVADNTVYAASVRFGDENEYKIYALDISDPSRPVEIGRSELPFNVTKMVADGDIVYMRLTDGEIWAMNISDRAHPYLAGRFRPYNVDFAIDDDLLYLAGGDAGLYIVQVTR